MFRTPTLFIDEHLLDDLYEKKTKAALEWTIGLNPKFGVKPVQLPVKERIEGLIECLDRSNQLYKTRPSYPSYDGVGTEFVLETCIATKVFIPTKNDPEPHFKGLVLWLSLEQVPSTNNSAFPAGTLCLLENFYHEKTRFHISGYTWLLSLLSETREKFEKTVLCDAFPGYASAQNWKSRWEMASQHLESFINNPFETLQQLGCRRGKERTIETLYHVRDYGPEEGDGRATTSIFGYPIFIRSA